MLSLDMIRRIAKRPVDAANAQSFLLAYSRYGSIMGLDQPHRLAQFLPQLMHESADFRYDREIWGPTPAQKRYDTRTDLGNTAAADGDGKLYMGRTGIQITGKGNYREFRDWCRAKVNPQAPDFVAKPDLVNTDPWEGLGPFWYWDTRGLNRFADAGNVEMITRRINGGLNGYDDRLDYLTRTSLVLLGYGPTDVKAFQADRGLLADGIAGPATRSALHGALVKTARPIPPPLARPEPAPTVAREARVEPEHDAPSSPPLPPDRMLERDPRPAPSWWSRLLSGFRSAAKG
jgi:putative chitinase